MDVPSIGDLTAPPVRSVGFESSVVVEEGHRVGERIE
jgi:hypothetical protein